MLKPWINLFNSTSISYGLFNDEILFISKYLIIIPIFKLL